MSNFQRAPEKSLFIKMWGAQIAPHKRKKPYFRILSPEVRLSSTLSEKASLGGLACPVSDKHPAIFFVRRDDDGDAFALRPVTTQEMRQRPTADWNGNGHSASIATPILPLERSSYSYGKKRKSARASPGTAQSSLP
jgi:hypothetical protein